MSVRNGNLSPLEALGVSEGEEEVYRTLLGIEGGSVADVGRASGLSERRVRQALTSLESKGLVARSARRRGEYVVPAPPEAAVDMLIMRKQEQLNAIRLAARDLIDDLGRAAGKSGANEMVELLTAGEGLITRNDQLLMSAQREILAFTVPPLRVPDQTFVDFKLDILRRGVKARAVYSPEALEAPGVLSFIEAVRPAGEEARVAATVPMWLLIIDRRVGFVPARADKPGASNDYLLVHPSSLLDSLIALFESLWQRAIPFEPRSSMPAAASTGDETLSPDERRVLALLTAGMQDASIAQQLGVTLRTVQRHVRHIMEVLGTNTRFQTGVAACRRGLVGVSSEDEHNRKERRPA